MPTRASMQDLEVQRRPRRPPSGTAPRTTRRSRRRGVVDPHRRERGRGPALEVVRRPLRGRARPGRGADPRARGPRADRAHAPHRVRRPRATRFDLRRTLRRSLRTQGEPFDRAWRDRTARRRPLVLILDISGSMAPYSRALMQFALRGDGRRAAGRGVRVRHAAHARDADAADQGSRPRDARDRTTGRGLGGRHPDRRVARALLDGWSQRAALRGAVVVLCSDGLERGDPELLRAQMARLRRLAHRVVWVNPLKGSPAVRAARPRHGRGAAERRRVPVGSQPREHRGARGRAGGLSPAGRRCRASPLGWEHDARRRRHHRGVRAGAGRTVGRAGRATRLEPRLLARARHDPRGERDRRRGDLREPSDRR